MYLTAWQQKAWWSIREEGWRSDAAKEGGTAMPASLQKPFISGSPSSSVVTVSHGRMTGSAWSCFRRPEFWSSALGAERSRILRSKDQDQHPSHDQDRGFESRCWRDIVSTAVWFHYQIRDWDYRAREMGGVEIKEEILPFACCPRSGTVHQPQRGRQGYAQRHARQRAIHSRAHVDGPSPSNQINFD